MARVLILGGGFGGIAAAHKLRELTPDTEVVLVDKGSTFMMGFRKTDLILGRDDPASFTRSLDALNAFGIRVVRGTIEAIDPDARAATVDGERIEADALLIALGATHVMGAVPGLSEHGINTYAHDQLARAGEASGRVVIGIFGAPYTCPPAPFELALLLKERAMESRSKATYEVFSPLPSSLPIVGPAGCEAIEGRMLGVGVEFRREAKAERVEEGRVILEGGDEVVFDTLLAIPPHRPPKIVLDAGFDGWIKPDPRTLETSFENVFAVGDVTHIPMGEGKALPKAGALAEDAARIAAEHIAARLAGTTSDASYDAIGGCYLETGFGEAFMVRGRFLAQPPEVELTPPSREMLEQKHAWEQERLAAWFGS